MPGLASMVFILAQYVNSKLTSLFTFHFPLENNLHCPLARSSPMFWSVHHPWSVFFKTGWWTDKIPFCFDDCYVKDEHLYNVPVIASNTLRCPQNRKMQENRKIRDSITFMSNGKHEFVPCDQVSRNFELFYLLIFYFERFSTWIWRLLFAVYMKLKLSISSHICGKRQTLRSFQKRK